MNAIAGGKTCLCQCFFTCGCKYAGPQEGPDDSFYGGSSQEVSGEASAQNAAHQPALAIV